MDFRASLFTTIFITGWFSILLRQIDPQFVTAAKSNSDGVNNNLIGLSKQDYSRLVRWHTKLRKQASTANLTLASLKWTDGASRAAWKVVKRIVEVQGCMLSKRKNEQLRSITDVSAGYEENIALLGGASRQTWANAVDNWLRDYRSLGAVLRADINTFGCASMKCNNLDVTVYGCNYGIGGGKNGDPQTTADNFSTLPPSLQRRTSSTVTPTTTASTSKAPPKNTSISSSTTVGVEYGEAPNVPTVVDGVDATTLTTNEPGIGFAYSTPDSNTTVLMTSNPTTPLRLTTTETRPYFSTISEKHHALPAATPSTPNNNYHPHGKTGSPKHLNKHTGTYDQRHGARSTPLSSWFYPNPVVQPRQSNNNNYLPSKSSQPNLPYFPGRLHPLSVPRLAVPDARRLVPHAAYPQPPLPSYGFGPSVAASSFCPTQTPPGGLTSWIKASDLGICVLYVRGITPLLDAHLLETTFSTSHGSAQLLRIDSEQQLRMVGNLLSFLPPGSSDVVWEVAEGSADVGALALAAAGPAPSSQNPGPASAAGEQAMQAAATRRRRQVQLSKYLDLPQPVYKTGDQDDIPFPPGAPPPIKREKRFVNIRYNNVQFHSNYHKPMAFPPAWSAFRVLPQASPRYLAVNPMVSGRSNFRPQPVINLQPRITQLYPVRGLQQPVPPALGFDYPANNIGGKAASGNSSPACLDGATSPDLIG